MSRSVSKFEPVPSPFPDSQWRSSTRTVHVVVLAAAAATATWNVVPSGAGVACVSLLRLETVTPVQLNV